MRMVATFSCSCYCGYHRCTAVVLSRSYSRFYSRSFLYGRIVYDWNYRRIQVDQTTVVWTFCAEWQSILNCVHLEKRKK